MPDLGYRERARSHFQEATGRLKQGSETALRAACLELRMCIEALAYEMLERYLSEVPNTAMEVWQPKRILDELLETDPLALVEWTMTTEDPDGREVSLGTERKLNPSWATKVYNTLGNFLHVPTVREIKRGTGLTYEERHQRCIEFVECLRGILDSPIYNIHLPVLFQTDCECGFRIARRVEFKKPGDLITCGQCGSQHYFHGIVEGRVQLTPRRATWSCNCGTQNTLPFHKAKEGTQVTCSHCGFTGHAVQVLQIHPMSGDQSS